MGFRQEIDEEYERKLEEQKGRQLKARIIRKYCEDNDLPFLSKDENKIVNPENYDDWGYPRHWTS